MYLVNLYRMEETVGTSMQPPITITRLPKMGRAEMAEHLVRWHGMYVEQVRDVDAAQLAEMHLDKHRKAAADGGTLGHRHDLDQAEAKLLEQGAAAALRRGQG